MIHLSYAKCTLRTVAPKGMSEIAAILKNCIPNGIPTIVMLRRHPSTKFINASSIPPAKNQITFKRNEKHPGLDSISFPKGLSEIDASLKHCNPTGIPMIVMHHKHPVMIHESQLIKPPHIIQSIFPKILMI